MVFMALLFVGTSVSAQAPAVNLSDPGFKIIACDGPEGLGHVNPQTGAIDLTKVNGQYKYPLKSGYVPCNFKGVMIQLQHLINIMMAAGVLVAIVGFSYAGFLYITGKKGNIDKAHEIFPKVFFGFIIMLSAWFIVYQILSWLTDNGGFSTLLGNP